MCSCWLLYRIRFFVWKCWIFILPLFHIQSKSIDRNALYSNHIYTHTHTRPIYSCKPTNIVPFYFIFFSFSNARVFAQPEPYFCVLNQIEFVYSWIRQSDCFSDEKFKYRRIKHDRIEQNKGKKSNNFEIDWMKTECFCLLTAFFEFVWHFLWHERR